MNTLSFSFNVNSDNAEALDELVCTYNAAKAIEIDSSVDDGKVSITATAVSGKEKEWNIFKAKVKALSPEMS